MSISINEEYNSHLIKQYMDAIGTSKLDIDSNTFLSDFKSWLEARKYSGEAYLGLLFRMGFIKVSSRETAEIGKGIHDTVAKPLDTTIITPYYEELSKRAIGSVIKANFKVNKGNPVIIPCKSDQESSLTNLHISNFMTHNPYNPYSITGWEQLPLKGYDMVVGMFGNIKDKDRGTKIKYLALLRDKLLVPSQMEITEYKDTYCGAVLARKRTIK